MKAVFITHAGSGIGGGHLSRCFALSQALKECGAASSWILNAESSSLAEAFSLQNTVYLADPFACDLSTYLREARLAVIDSYVPSSAFYAGVAACLPVVTIDDLADRGVERYSSVVINYGIAAVPGLYETGKTEYLLGPAYALLRQEYWDHEISEGDYVLFIPGAADVLNASERVLRLWRKEWPHLIIVLGSLVPEPRRNAMDAAARGRSNVSVKVAPENFADIMAKAGMVICSASVTAYEALGLQKKVAVFSVAANQAGLGEILSGMNVSYDLGAWEFVSAEGISDALRFTPDRKKLDSLVNRRGALACAEKLVEIVGDR